MKNYPKGTVRKLLDSSDVTPVTREALKNRLHDAINYQPEFFDKQTFNLLQAICRRLIQQDAVDCAVYIDKNFSENKSDGWRYDKLPEIGETFRRGLSATHQTSNSEYGKDFQQLGMDQQDKILTLIQQNKVSNEIRNTISAALFFEELLAQTVAVYYAHPVAQEEIGYVGMADAPGWTRIKLNELEEREPRIINL